MADFLKYRGFRYRVANWLDQAVALLLRPLWGLISKMGWSRQDVIAVFTKAWKYLVGREAAAVEIPDEIFSSVANLLADRGVSYADFAQSLAKQLLHPPAGFRWDVDADGNEHLIRKRHETEEAVVVRGQRFHDAVFIGVWWTAGREGQGATKKMRNLLVKLNGGEFAQRPYPEDPGLKEYYGFAVVLRMFAEKAASAICAAANLLDQQGGGEHRLSAIMLTSAEEHREVRAEDQIKLGCINSIKLNWKWNLTDLLMGRIVDLRVSGDFEDFVKDLRAYSGRL